MPTTDAKLRELRDVVDKATNKMPEGERSLMAQILQSLHVDPWDKSVEDLWAKSTELSGRLDALMLRTLSSPPADGSELRFLLATLQEVAGRVLVYIAERIPANEDGK